MTFVLEELRSYPDLLNLIGVLGFLTYISNFYMLQAGWICGNSPRFAIGNMLAACLVLISLVGAFNIASFLIQISYIAIGTWGICRSRRKQT